ncbi:YqaJ viral recombinase family protein [Nonomuraea sp. K274]|uniref:YqaJ viral recombinase family protein n=1 Tax=Nonomuraea cypriaca TaxID=1187855 RepID=A0A931A532_9ACTN|nr:YqaJ viral recombinase family protein [Nonomuraea cypriaca]MBF8186361.1 YqaJ viral recombinase family protein [Nonomuraea cypriaca]
MTAIAIEPAAPIVGRRVTPTARLVLPATAGRAEWLAARRGDHRDGSTRIGSSDVADILGVGYNVPLRVFHEKRGELPEDDNAGEAALWGNLHEETIAREWARRNRSVVRRVGLVGNDERPWMTCTLDRRVTECPLNREQRETCALEIKTRSAWLAGKWLRSTPDDVLAQVLWQMAVTGYDHVHVAVLIGGNDYRQYVIRRNDHEAIIENLIAAADLMRQRIIAGDTPAPSGDPDRLVELYGDLYPERAGGLDVGPEVLDLLDRYETHRLAEKREKRGKDEAKADLIALLGGHERAQFAEEDAYSYTARRGRPAVALALMAEQYPDAYEACVTETTVRAINVGRNFRKTEES